VLDVAVVGCGIVGAAMAYELSQYDLAVAVLEKENDVAMGSTKANSAVIHAGFDPFPGTLMAKLNVEGAALAKKLCESLDIPHRHCGSLVLAFSDEEMAELNGLLDKAVKNGVPDVSIISRDALFDLEPNINGGAMAALHAPSAMIVDPWEYTLALAETAAKNGVDIRLECAVTGIREIIGGYSLQTPGGAIEARTVVNAAGLYADEVHNMIAPPSFKIRPAKGEYCLMDKSEGGWASAVIFQCPTEAGKGVLVAPTVHGNLIVGPGRVDTDSKNDVATTTGGLEFVLSAAQKSVPSIDFGAVIRNFSGIRARSTRRDFIIEEALPGFIDLAGIKSPGLSAAPAIAKMAAEMLGNAGIALNKKQAPVDKRRRTRFGGLAAGEKAKLVDKDPAYGRVICRCETITEGEVCDALRAPIPPRSIDGVKRRCGAGMGRCQGGFCGSRVLEILAAHYGCPASEVLQDGAGTFVLMGETKQGGKHGDYD